MPTTNTLTALSMKATTDGNVLVTAIGTDGTGMEGTIDAALALAYADRFIVVARTAIWNRIDATPDERLREAMKAAVGGVIPRPGGAA